MNFAIEHLGRAGERVGNLELKSKIFQTPFPLLGTKGGSVPHLTRETLGYLNFPEFLYLLPYQHHSKQTDVLQAYKKGLCSFVGLQGAMSLLTVQDPTQETRSGYNGNKNVSVFNNCNREVITTDRYLEFAAAAMPSLWIPLCDGDTPPSDCSKKRISKAVRKSLDFLDTCLENRLEHEHLKNVPIIAAVEGGLDPTARKYASAEAAKRPVDGFLLDGFHMNGPTAEKLDWGKVKEALQVTMQSLPEDKPRFYFGAATPELVFELISAGVDVFDTSYPYLVTEREHALVFNNIFLKDNFIDKVVQQEKKNELSLHDQSLQFDMSPLVRDCSCYTCKNFSRSYIHHLVSVKEMLGKVLLTLHNLHHYLTFFKSVRAAAKHDQIENFRRSVLR